MHFTDQWVILGLKQSKVFAFCFVCLFVFYCLQLLSFSHLFPDPIGCFDWSVCGRGLRQKGRRLFLLGPHWGFPLNIPFRLVARQSASVYGSIVRKYEASCARVVFFVSSFLRSNFKLVFTSFGKRDGILELTRLRNGCFFIQSRN